MKNSLEVKELMKKERRFNSIYTLKGSIEKLFGYLEAVSKVPFFVSFKENKKNVILKFYPVKKVVVSDNLFREYSCLDYNCSRCCWKKRDFNIYTTKQFEELKNKYPNENLPGKKEIIFVNDKIFEFYVEENINQYCRHLDDINNKCKIHTANPIHCALPLIKFKQNKKTNTTHITREYFGRNWFMNCPVKFKPMTEEGFNTTIWMLSRVKDMADELNIPTYLPEVIEEVKMRWRK